MERIHRYGVVGVGETKGKMFKVTEMVEKPPREKAPSNLIITGRYILQPEIFDILATQSRGAGNEIQLTDAMIELAKTQPFYGFKFEGDELRLRLEDRLPRRQRRLCAGAPRHRARAARGTQAADGPRLISRSSIRGRGRGASRELYCSGIVNCGLAARGAGMTAE